MCANRLGIDVGEHNFTDIDYADNGVLFNQNS